MAILECVLAQRKGDGTARAAASSATGLAESFEEDDGDRASASSWACLGASWWCGDALCRGRGQGEGGVDGASACSGVSRDMAVHALACSGCPGHVCAGQCQPLLGQGRVQ
jgi:hypothetical protein